MEAGRNYRVTALAVLGVLVCGVAWLNGCGGYVAGGGSSSSSITGTIVDYKSNVPIAGALVVLEQPDGTGTDRIVASTTSASNGSFGFNPASTGVFDVVADATITPVSGSQVTYAATVVFGVLAKANLNQIPLVPEFGSASPTGTPATIVGNITSAGTTIGFPAQVDVKLSALESVSPAVGAVNRITIPAFKGSTASITTMSNASCTSGTDCLDYSLVVPAGNFSFGTFNALGTYTLVLQQPTNVNYTVEGIAFVAGTGLLQTCSPSTLSTPIVIVSGTPTFTNPNLAFTGCLL